jgi:hypothetical protein
MDSGQIPNASVGNPVLMLAECFSRESSFNAGFRPETCRNDKSSVSFPNASVGNPVLMLDSGQKRAGMTGKSSVSFPNASVGNPVLMLDSGQKRAGMTGKGQNMEKDDRHDVRASSDFVVVGFVATHRFLRLPVGVFGSGQGDLFPFGLVGRIVG